MWAVIAMKTAPRMLGPQYYLVNAGPPTSHDVQNRGDPCRRRTIGCRVFSTVWTFYREDERATHRRERHDGGSVGVSEDSTRRRLARRVAVVRGSQARLQDLYEHAA